MAIEVAELTGVDGAGEVRVAVSTLVRRPLVRTILEPDVVDRFVGLAGRWSPIVVEAGTMLVIDGNHRVAAAERLGMRSLVALLYDGDDPLIEAMRCNVDDQHHGLTKRE